MFIIILNYIKPLSEVNRLLDEHRTFLAQYYHAGHFFLSGPKEPRDGGIILATANTKAEIEAIISDDPFHREGIADYTIIEFIPSRAAEPFSEFVPQPTAAQ
ncbi:MAG TPA: YciI family protein [Cellvibrio sp.]|nr:YciI family protein [Cellvibrio sp.]